MRLTKELSISKNEYKQGASETQHNPPIKNHTLIHFGYILIFRKCFQIFPTFVNSIQLFWKAFPLFGNRIQFFWKCFLSFGNRFHLLETVCLNWIEYPNYGNSFGFNWIQAKKKVTNTNKKVLVLIKFGKEFELRKSFDHPNHMNYLTVGFKIGLLLFWKQFHIPQWVDKPMGTLMKYFQELIFD